MPDIVDFVPYFTLGKQINRHIAAEVRLGINLFGGRTSNATVTVGSGSGTLTANPEVEITVDRLAGGYLRFGDFASETFYPYLIVGYTSLKATSEISDVAFNDVNGNPTGDIIPGSKTTESESSTSFGFGFKKEFKDDGRWFDDGYFALEFMRYIADDDGDVTGFMLQFGESF